MYDLVPAYLSPERRVTALTYRRIITTRAYDNDPSTQIIPRISDITQTWVLDQQPYLIEIEEPQREYNQAEGTFSLYQYGCCSDVMVMIFGFGALASACDPPGGGLRPITDVQGRIEGEYTIKNLLYPTVGGPDRTYCGVSLINQRYEFYDPRFPSIYYYATADRGATWVFRAIDYWVSDFYHPTATLTKNVPFYDTQGNQDDGEDTSECTLLIE